MFQKQNYVQINIKLFTSNNYYFLIPTQFTENIRSHLLFLWF